MAFIDDLKNAVDNYSTDNCKTEITNFSITGGGGAVLNVGETFQFQVRVTNESHLNMKVVKVKALGTSFADVALGVGPFSSGVSASAFDLPAHQVHSTGFFRGKAKALTGVPKDIVLARIDAWDASLDHILIDHSDAGAAEGKLTKDVKAD